MERYNMKNNNLSDKIANSSVKFTEEHRKQFSSCNDFYDKMQQSGVYTKEGYVGDTPTISDVNKENNTFCYTYSFF